MYRQPFLKIGIASGCFNKENFGGLFIYGTRGFIRKAPPLFYLFTLLHPALDHVPGVADLVVDVVLADVDVDSRKAPGVLDALARLQVGVGDGGEPPLVAPQQVRYVGHGDGDQQPAGADAEGQRDRGP